MNLIEGILSRQSLAGLGEPAPAASVLDRAFRCAVAAPDHGRLRPWRFVVCQGDDRLKLGRLLGQSMKRRQPEATDAMIAQEEARVLRAPLIVTALCEPPSTERIPEIEQMLAVGAAVQNLCLALHAEGFGAIWRTGPAAYDPAMATSLGFGPSARIVGFIYVGTPLQPAREAARPAPDAFVRRLA
jgi:nitroreductase